jgi:putative SOS response-associated peptidase YedK
LPETLCNLYSIITNQEAIRALFRKVNRYVGNLAPMPGVFPDYPAPVIGPAATADEAEMLLMRWGMPPPPRTGGPPVTNIRNTTSPHWRMWLRLTRSSSFVAASNALGLDVDLTS